MRLSAFARMNVVHKEEKESRLKEFIARDLANRRAAGGGAQELTVYRLIALSADSPAAKALAELSEEIAALGITIDAIFFRKRGIAENFEGLDPHHCRYATDPRLLDAHEQLVLGPQSVWIGDCMRREPGKRDAFECYSEGCEATSRRAVRSFEHIWLTAKPAKHGSAARVVDTSSPHDLLAATLAATAGEEGDPSAFRPSRH